MSAVVLASGVESPDDNNKVSSLEIVQAVKLKPASSQLNTSSDGSDFDGIEGVSEPCSSQCPKRKLASEVTLAFDFERSLKRPCSSPFMAVADQLLPEEQQERANAWISFFLQQAPEWQGYVMKRLVKTVDPSLSQQWKIHVDEMLKRDVFAVVPWELARMIVGYLSPEDLLQASRVSMRWRSICLDERLWRKHCMDLNILRSPFTDDVPFWFCDRSSWVRRECNCEVVSGLVCHSHVHRNSNRVNLDEHMGDHRVPLITIQDGEENVEDIENSCGSNDSQMERPVYFPVFMRYSAVMRNWIRRPLFYNSTMSCGGHTHNVVTCMITFDDYIATGSDDNSLIVWSISKAERLRVLIGHYGGVWSLVYSPPTNTRDFGLLVSGSTDRTAKVWNPETGELLHTFFGHTSTVRCLAVHGDIAISGSRDTLLRSWNISSGDSIGILQGHSGAVRCVKFDGSRVISGSYDYTIRVWDVNTNNSIFHLVGHGNRVYALAVDWDRNILASGSLDTTVRVWDLTNGKCLHELKGHSSLTSGLEIRDNTLISCNADGTCIIWDLQEGVIVHRLGGEIGHSSAITGVRFLRTGLVVTSSDDGTVKLWDSATGCLHRDLLRVDTRMVCIWRIECTDTMLIVAIGSRPERAHTRIVMIDFNAPLFS